MPFRTPLAALAAALTLFLIPVGSPGNDDGAQDPWQALAEEAHVVLLRHALAPGTGDPFDFEPGNCATQRNLDDRGRAQAQAIGQAFRDRSIAVTRVLSSAWCRCLETAELLALGEVETLWLLDSLVQHRDTALERTSELQDWILAQREPGVQVLVTHNTNISSLTGILPASGEAVVVGRSPDGGLRVVGRIPAPPTE